MTRVSLRSVRSVPQLGVYRQTVLVAFGQIADILRSLQHDTVLLFEGMGGDWQARTQAGPGGGATTP